MGVDDTHAEHLKNPKIAAEYLKCAIETGDKGMIRLALEKLSKALLSEENDT